MAFSKIEGFEVNPRRESSSIMRPSSPDSIMLRRIWSSQILTPAAVRAASRSLTCAVALIASSSRVVLVPSYSTATPDGALSDSRAP